MLELILLCIENAFPVSSKSSLLYRSDPGRTRSSVYHPSVVLHNCPFCSYSTPYKGNLPTHIKTHSEERPYSCEICSKSYKLKSHLARHVQSHSAELPFKCTVCDKSFHRKDRWKLHVQAHDVALADTLD
ncbi:gastrula zinc finger protein XlCGF49.1-like [Uloborus diversus]|uniref:gastrula zinc finger protein XlCGF49.1-like n=1 Tax=Uloborus diversus TaxID=327109 RepID=UPI0024096D4E|nr:gastrula zinc finger protein XlCGF49.1-like [Uloborus diversus]